MNSKFRKGWIRPVSENSRPDQNPLGIDLENYIRSGNAYNYFSRDFVEWIFKNETIQNFLNWDKLQQSYTPDEFTWAILQALPGTPGGVLEPDE